MRKFTAALIAAVVALALPAAAEAAACKDAKGKFVKCPPAAAATHAAKAEQHATAAQTHATAAKKEATAAKKESVAAKKTAAKPAAPAKRCRNAKGQFTKCGTPGSKPV